MKMNGTRRMMFAWVGVVGLVLAGAGGCATCPRSTGCCAQRCVHCGRPCCADGQPAAPADDSPGADAQTPAPADGGAGTNGRGSGTNGRGSGTNGHVPGTNGHGFGANGHASGTNATPTRTNGQEPGANGQEGDAHKPGVAKTARRFDFSETAVGKVPDGWRVEGTKQSGPLATWQVVEDPTAPSPPRALGLVESKHGSDPTYNLCWVGGDACSFRDGTIALRVKAVSGEVDQGGGPMWRVRDHDNYYICRVNPLERNFRVYRVVGGVRKQLASADTDAAAGEWHSIEVEHRGHHVVCKLNGAHVLDVTDEHLPDAGGVGLWTKADAVTTFDDLVIRAGSER
jgi:hypothetical protein